MRSAAAHSGTGLRYPGDTMVSIRDILFATDLSPDSDQAFEHARLVAQRLQASLTVFHAIEVPRHGGGPAEDGLARTEADARQALERRAESLDVSHRVLVERVPSAPEALLERIRATQPDLTVMATHSRGALSHLLFGSVTESVVEHAFRPILCVREPDHGGPLPYRRILVPTDLTLASRLAFPAAACLAQAFGAEVFGVHVTPTRGLTPVNPVVPSELAVWNFLQPDFEGMALSARVLTGTVWERIVHTASADRIDLIVISTRGHTRLADRFFGSTAERVVRHAPCPVLVA